MRHFLTLAAIMALQSAPVFAEDFSAKAYFGHRTAAADAANRDDLATAQAEINAARALLPSSPSILLMGARIAEAAQKPDEARAWLKDYIGRGLWFDPVRNAALAAHLNPTDRATLDENSKPVGDVTTVTQTDALRLVEGVAIAGGKTWYTTIHDGALNQAGRAMPVYPLPEGRGAYGISANDSGIWVVASPDQAQTASAAAQPSEILCFDPASPGAPKTFPGPAASRFGDIALGTHHVYVSDGGTGAVLRLDPATGAWTAVLPAGRLPSPQGLAESAHGKALVVADYTSGLYRVDLISGDILHLEVPKTASLVGIDGVTRFGNDLIVIQNGIQPARILRIHMSTDWKAIDSVEVLLRGGKLDEPTNGVVSGDRYVFVARSQWSDFDGDGTAKATHGPAIIGEIKLRH